MRLFILLFAFISFEAFAGNCTTTTRTNYNSGQILTSTALNADLNQLVTKVNSLDGGCVTDGTLEAAALNSTDFATVTNGIHQGCALTLVDANTIGVGKCILSVNGNLVKTTTQTNVTWGCTDCSAEVNNTLYYLYARGTSTGTTLNLLISTTAPGVDGYDASSNKVLGKFRNGEFGAAGDIYDASIENWSSNNYFTSGSRTQYAKPKTFTFDYAAAGGLQPCTVNGACAGFTSFDGGAVSFARTATGTYTLTVAEVYSFMLCSGNHSTTLSVPGYYDRILSVPATSTTFTIRTVDASGAAVDTSGIVTCQWY